MDEEHTTAGLRAGFSLGPWTVLPNQNRLEAEPDAVHLEPKVMEVLCMLARHQGEVVSRNDLLEEVWAGTYVTDEVLSRAISVLRSQLGDDRKNPEYIATIPKAGYRLIKPIAGLDRRDTSATTASAPTDTSAPATARKRRLLIAGGLAAILLVAFLGMRDPPPPVIVDPLSPTLFEDMSDWFELIIRGDVEAGSVVEIAVLPFDDLSEQAGNAFLSDGLTDELIISLGQLEGLKVVARSSSLSFRNRNEDVRAIGDILQVDAVVEGTVKRVGEQIRISAQLSSTEDGFLLWSQTFDRDLSDLLSLQSEISAEIIAALRSKLQLQQLQVPLPQQAEADMEAYQLYLNGRFLWKLRGDSPLRRSVTLFEQALELDPGFTRARLALANSLVLLPYYSDEDEEQSFARALAQLEQLDEGLSPPEAGAREAIHGFIALRRWQWQLAEQHFLKALLLEPNNPNAYVWYSQFLSSVGRKVDALKTAQQAHDLDSVSPVVNSRLAIAYLWSGDNVRAAEQFARGASLGFVNMRDPGFLIFLLRMQRFDEARRLLEQLYAAAGADPRWMVEHIEAITLGDRDLVDDAVEAVERGDVFPRLQLGLWLYLGEPERVVDVVRALSAQKKYVDLELVFTAEGRDFRDSDAFEDLAEEIGLVEFWEYWRGPDEE